MFSRSVLPLLVLLAACESVPPNAPPGGPPDPTALLLAAPERGFQLTDQQRKQLPPAVNAQALERLLARVRPEYRAQVIQGYREIAAQGPVSFGPASTLVHDPEFAALARAVVVSPERARSQETP